MMMFLSFGGKVEIGAQGPFERVAAVRVDAECDLSLGELGNIEDGTVVRLFEENADLAGVLIVNVVEEDDMERCASNAIAVICPVSEPDLDT